VVELVTVAPRTTAVVRAATTWQDFPLLWKGMLDEVWVGLHAVGIRRGCRNVMLYKDDVPNVEVGVVVADPGPLGGRVVASALPAGQAAMTVHRGGYGGLSSAHESVAMWCAAQGLRRAGPRWEIYGPHHDDPRQLETEIYHLLA
jgi:effector-binding domain-containing protein